MTIDIDDLLTKSNKAGASDIHLNCGKAPALRVNGEIFKVAGDPVTNDDVNAILEKTLPKEYKCDFLRLMDVDYVYEIPSVARFRVNYCKDISHGKLTFRTIPYRIKTIKELGLPAYLEEYTKISNGIVFITGATGSGKSTTLASLIDIINSRSKKHVITIEDPVEFVYEEKKSIITQRSIGLDVQDFKTGIKYALRQDPDVILVGEVRDSDTLLSAIEASETGHIVFSTLHTNGTIASIDRLKGILEEGSQLQLTKRLANCVRGIIHQQLVPSVNDGKLVPALEILTFTSTVVDYVKDDKLVDIQHLMQRSRQPNIVTMNMSLYDLYQREIITKETALKCSLDKVDMDQMLRGLYRNSSDEEKIR